MKYYIIVNFIQFMSKHNTMKHDNEHSSVVSEWLLFNANLAICLLYHGEHKLIFSEMMLMSAL